MQRPNILFLMPDQLRWDFVGAYGKPFARTPNIDALAESGKVFSRCLSPSPLCIPARASMLTGHNALSTGVLNNNYWLRPDHAACGVPSFAELLSAAGYHTEAIGKMHFIPWDISEGFDHRVIAEDKRHIHIQDDYSDYLKAHGLRKFAGIEEPGYVEGRMASVSLVPEEHQVDTWVGQKSMQFFDNYTKDKPFLLWVAFPGPHDPYNPPLSVLEDVDEDMPLPAPATAESEAFRPEVVSAHEKGSAGINISEFPNGLAMKIRKHYQGLVRIIDEQVGAILKALDRRDDGRETLIVFASDHGDFLGDFGLLGKTLFFENSMRVPMIVAGAGVEPGVANTLVSLTDVFATFTTAAGLSPTCQDSVSLPGIGLGNRRRDHLMGATEKGMMIDDGRFKLSRYRNGVCCLYDVLKDPEEQHNLWRSHEHLSHRQKLEVKLHEWTMASLMDGHSDKTYPYMTMTPDHPGHKRGWQRSYPADPWSQRLERGVH